MPCGDAHVLGVGTGDAGSVSFDSPALMIVRPSQS